jgi:hypothetical protein
MDSNIITYKNYQVVLTGEGVTSRWVVYNPKGKLVSGGFYFLSQAIDWVDQCIYQNKEN